MNDGIKNREYLNLNYLWILLYAGGLGAFLIGMPKYTDDYWYMAPLKIWFDAQGILNLDEGGNIMTSAFPWREICDVWIRHYEMDNIRLGNIIGTVFLIFPKWFGSGIALLCWMYSILKCMQLAGIDTDRSALVPVGLFLWCFGMPWWDDLGSLIFQMNYIGATTVGICLTGIVVNGRTGWCHNVTIVLMAVVMAWWHEGFAVPMAVGLCALIIFKREYRNVGMYVCVMSLVFVTVLTMCTPGMLFRLGYVVDRDILSGWRGILNGFRFRYGLILFLLLVVMCMFRVDWRRKLANPVFILLGTSAVVCAAISSVMSLWVRSGWWCDFASIGCVIYVLRVMAGQYFVDYGWYNMIVWIPMLCIVYVHFFTVACYVNVISKDRDNLLHAFATVSDEPYFGTPQVMSDTSPFCFMLPGFKYADGIMWAEQMYFDGSASEAVHDRYYVVPRELEYVNADTGRELPGGAGVREYKGRYFMPADSLWIGAAMVPIDFGKGYVPVPTYFNDFISKGDGRRYVWLNMKLNWFVTHFRQPKAAGLGFKEIDRRRWKDLSCKEDQTLTIQKSFSSCE